MGISFLSWQRNMDHLMGEKKYKSIDRIWSMKLARILIWVKKITLLDGIYESEKTIFSFPYSSHFQNLLLSYCLDKMILIFSLTFPCISFASFYHHFFYVIHYLSPFLLSSFYLPLFLTPPQTLPLEENGIT